MYHKKSREQMMKAVGRSPVVQTLTVRAPFVRGYMETEKALHILCECVALAYFRFSRLGKYFYGTQRL
jgi:hypothetical protein